MTETNLYQEQVNQAVECILDGGVIIYPTETIWGLGCDATSDSAILKVYKIKGRNFSKKVITLIAEPKDIFSYVSNPPPDILDIIGGFERPTSMIFDDVVGLSSFVMDGGAAGLRIADTALDKSLIRQSGKPIVTTSANLSGDPSPLSYDDINPALLDSVDLVVDPETVDYEMTGRPSDIVRISADGSLTYIRR